ncbi:MAG: alpha/beta fold hydrolase [Propionicimonas sp.]|nr:alpha/beta fold hydrolase [Propionicimonas sp.]
MDVAAHAQPFHAGRARIAVLFLHGFNSSPHTLREWAELTADAGYRVALPRLPGHGTDWRELDATGWRDWYACAERELLTLAAACDQVFVVGHSMGGTLALRLAEHHPGSVAGLILVNPGLIASRLQRLAPLASRVVPTWPSGNHDVARPGTPRHGYERTPLRAASSILRLFADVRASLDLVTCPLLVFRSAEDHVVPGSSTDYLRSHVSSEDIAVSELARSYHVATLDYDREQVFSGSLAFIASHSH